MEPDLDFKEETLGPTADLQTEGSESQRRVPQQKEAVQSIPPVANSNQKAQEASRIISKRRSKPHPPSGEARRTQAGNSESSSRAPQTRQAANKASSTADRVQNSVDRESHFEPKDPRRASTNPTSENDHTPTFHTEHHFKQQFANLERHCRNLESEQKELIRLIDSLNVNVRESEAQRENLQQRLEEASNTILRLRPPRQEYTESEIEEDYERLIKAIKNWVSVNCEAFLDDDLRGYGALLRHRPHQSNCLEPFEEIIAKFHSKFSQWTEPKEHVLVAVVMRYIYERILTQGFSVLLTPEERSTLASIEKGLKDPRLQKDLPTVRAWRNDTITAVDSYPSFTTRATSIERGLTSDLHNYLRGALSDENENSIKRSLCKEVIAPAMGLAHKTQSASSIWEFGYSDYLASKPGEFGSRLPNFLANIQHFRCINLSKRGKLLKQDTDLTTREEQESLCYMLDIFPGLYCQRVAAGSSPLSSTISQPILLVAFATEDGLDRTQQSHSVPSNPETSTQNRNASATRPVSTGRSSGVFHTLKNYIGLKQQNS